MQNVAERTSSHVPIHYHPIIICTLCLLASSIPLGSWQHLLLHGLTIPKIITPLLFLAILLTNQLAISNISFPLLTFIVLMSPSFFLAKDTQTFMLVYLTFIGYLVVLSAIKLAVVKTHHVHKILKSFLLSLTIITSFCMLAAFTRFDLGDFLFHKPLLQIVFDLKRMMGTNDNPNAFAVYLIAGVPLAVSYFFLSKSTLSKLYYITCCMMYAACLILTVCRSAILGAIVAITIIVLYRFKLLKPRFIILISIPAIFLGIQLLTAPQYISHFSLARTASSRNVSRLSKDKVKSIQLKKETIKQGLIIAANNPIFGIGFGNLRDEMEKSKLNANSPNNLYLAIITSYGFPAFFIFLYIVYIAYHNLLFAIKSNASKELKALSVALLGLFTGLLLHGLGHTNYVQFILWLVLGLTDACRLIAYREHHEKLIVA